MGALSNCPSTFFFLLVKVVFLFCVVVVCSYFFLNLYSDAFCRSFRKKTVHLQYAEKKRMCIITK